MNHRPRKRFGQNFLHDQHVVRSIIQCIHPQPTDHLIEIGPGLGALTKPLLERLNALTAIEIDTDLYAHLNTLSTADHPLHLIQADVLTVDFRTFGNAIRVVGNLPYNISTPLLIRLLQVADCIQDMHFMLQKEVVERLAAAPGTKDYGRLSVMAQYYCDVINLFHVPPSAFTPAPKVDSAIVRLTPYHVSPYPDIPFSVLEQFVAMAFRMRRKTLANNLKPILTANELIDLNINPQWRPEQISVIEYVTLANYANRN